MAKEKYFITIFLAMLLLVIIPNFSQATVEYTRTIPGNDGSILINLTGVELDETKAYSYALTTLGGTPTTWHTLTEYTASTAQVNLGSATTDIADVLKITDTGMLYVKDDLNDNYVVDALRIDLKLPYLQAISYSYSESSGWYSIEPKLYGSIGNQYASTDQNVYYKLEKVTDKNFVETFLKNNKRTTELEELLPVPPESGYAQDGYFKVDKNDGLYIIWIKLTGDNCKTVTGAIIHDGLPEATTVAEYLEGVDLEEPTVSSISVTSPASGTYTTGQTVKITVTFSEEITGTTVPTLKIRFGTSEERTVTNGTISGKTIVYSYNIAAGDVGQLAVTGYSGGNIKDASGNDAVISSRTLSGNTIKANVAGTDTNNQGSQEPNNNEEENPQSGNNNPNGGSTDGENPSNGSSNTEKDPTVAPEILPKAGLESGIILTIIVILVSAILMHSKYNKLRDI